MKSTFTARVIVIGSAKTENHLMHRVRAAVAESELDVHYLDLPTSIEFDPDHIKSGDADPLMTIFGSSVTHSLCLARRAHKVCPQMSIGFIADGKGEQMLRRQLFPISMIGNSWFITNPESESFDRLLREAIQTARQRMDFRATRHEINTKLSQPVFSDDQKFTKMALSEHFLVSILENANDAIIGQTLDGTITIWNRGAEKLYGYTVDEVIGKSISIVVPNDRHYELPYILECVRNSKLIEHFETQHIRKDGSAVYISLSVSPIVDTNGERVGASVIARDITEGRNAQERLRRFSEELQRSNDDLEQFAYAASHDLRAPLRAIHNLSICIEEDLDDAMNQETRELLALMRKRIDRMRKFLDDLLEFARVARVRHDRELIDVKNLIEDILTLGSIPENCTYEIAPGMPILKAPKIPLEQVFFNIVMNGLKHNDKDSPHLKISCEDLGESYLFAVSDNGPGIPNESHDKIFAAFETLRSRDDTESSGLGLAMVKKIIERYGGTIDLQSAIGEGTTFRFTWPKEFE